jgi:hypothetical protein
MFTKPVRLNSSPETISAANLANMNAEANRQESFGGFLGAIKLSLSMPGLAARYRRAATRDRAGASFYSS